MLTLRLAAVGLLLLVPCFWQPLLHTSDLPSHIYNAWLAGEVRAGRAPGLALHPVYTNVLADWLLDGLLAAMPAAWAERVAGALAIQIFFWGVWHWAAVVAGRWPWALMPGLAMVSYGAIFHLGFLNFYLATGLGAWALAWGWQRRWWWAGGALTLAALAHGMPALWCSALLVYREIGVRWPRWWLVLAGLAGIGVLRMVLMALYPCEWGTWQLTDLAGATGADQAWVFGPRFHVLALAAGLSWLALLTWQGLDGVWGKVEGQLWLLHLGAFALLPGAVALPGHGHQLAFIPQRIALWSAALLLLMLGRTPAPRVWTAAAVVLSGGYFWFLFDEHRAAQQTVDRVTELVRSVPRGATVASGVLDEVSRVNVLAHVVDRACLGHCFSFGNYEPATRQFRLRATGPNRVAAEGMDASQAVGSGGYVVTGREAPVYTICEEGERWVVRKREAGEKTCAVTALRRGEGQARVAGQ